MFIKFRGNTGITIYIQGEQTTLSEVRGRAGGTDSGPVVLFVGSLFNRRHLPELIEGFTRMAQRHPQARLEIVGDNRTNPRIEMDQLISANGVPERVHWRSYIPDADLAALVFELPCP